MWHRGGLAGAIGIGQCFRFRHKGTSSTLFCLITCKIPLARVSQASSVSFALNFPICINLFPFSFSPYTASRHLQSQAKSLLLLEQSFQLSIYCTIITEIVSVRSDNTSPATEGSTPILQTSPLSITFHTFPPKHPLLHHTSLIIDEQAQAPKCLSLAKHIVIFLTTVYQHLTLSQSTNTVVISLRPVVGILYQNPYTLLKMSHPQNSVASSDTGVSTDSWLPLMRKALFYQVCHHASQVVFKALTLNSVTIQ